MNNRLVTVLFALLCPVTLWAQAGRGYFRAGLGPAFTQDTRLERFAEEPVSGTRMKYDTGIQFNFAGGFRFTDWVAAELESGVIHNSVRSVGVPSSGDMEVSQIPFLANVVFEIPTATPLVPYAGAGLGGSASLLFVDHFRAGATTADGDFSDFVFAYQAFAGLRYSFNNAMSISAGYRFFHADGSSWEPDVSFNTRGSIRATSQTTHMVSVAFMITF